MTGLRGRRLLLGLSILILAAGLFFLANATIGPRQTVFSTRMSTSNGTVPGQYFQYGGETATSANPPQIVVGTSGAGDLIILDTPVKNFSLWVCQHTPTPQLIPGATWNCANFGGGDINVAILYSYLQAYPSQILYSQTIIDQNVTLNYHATRDVTIVLAPLEPNVATIYWQYTQTNETDTYPLIGWTERAGSAWSLMNISIGLVTAGATVVVASVLTRSRTLSISSTPSSKSRRRFRRTGSRSTSKLGMRPIFKKCPACDGENLSFSNVCTHCGSNLAYESPVAEAGVRVN